ncbi:MAG TPA: Ni/Fe-hydrogenase, b-type cytochrome subunit [Sulfuricurvum sp.]|nr:Ni/Fe-hydrogenase, b-type cytochrome subunit [Sulfuricurvum sp.]
MDNTQPSGVEHISFVYSSANRILHWIRAIVITGLVITGFYIASPFLSSGVSSDDLIYTQWVSWHVVFGFILITAGLLRIYLFFFGPDSKSELNSLKDEFSLKSWMIQMKSYFFIGELLKKGMYGPLQFLAYSMIMLFVVLASITGLILYVHVYHQGVGGMLYDSMRLVESWMGGLANVRLVHHITMWGFLIFIPIHIYMVIWSAIRFKHGGVDIMFTGYDYHLKKKENEKE